MDQPGRHVQRRPDAVRERQAAMREAYRRLGSVSAAARELGVDRSTVKYAVDPAFAALRRQQMNFRYYLNNVLPRELDAEAAQ